MTGPSSGLSRSSGKLQVFVGMRHGFCFLPPSPFGFAFEYTVQSFSVIEEIDFSRVRLQFEKWIHTKR